MFSINIIDTCHTLQMKSLDFPMNLLPLISFISLLFFGLDYNSYNKNRPSVLFQNTKIDKNILDQNIYLNSKWTCHNSRLRHRILFSWQLNVPGNYIYNIIDRHVLIRSKIGVHYTIDDRYPLHDRRSVCTIRSKIRSVCTIQSKFKTDMHYTIDHRYVLYHRRSVYTIP